MLVTIIVKRTGTYKVLGNALTVGDVFAIADGERIV